VRKFFASIHHHTLLKIIKNYISDPNTLVLLYKIIGSFNTGQKNTGLPLGNLTSQLFANVYLDQFDQFMKHQLKVEYYIRYADDFVVLSQSQSYLENILPSIHEFLEDKLKLTIHPNKIFIRTIASGVDFLGWVHFPDHRVLRTTTKRRMFKRLRETNKPEVVRSYMGLLGHGNAYKLKTRIFG